MRKQWASEQPLHSSQLRSRMAATMENAITPALLRRHGLGRFSLRRLFGSLSFGRRTLARRCTTNIETDSRSENGSLTLSVGEHKNAHLAVNDRAKASVESLNGGDGTAEPLVECPVCLSELPPQCFPVLSTCRHHTCYDCFQRYLQVEISESRVSVTCPMCPESLHPNDIRMILNDESFTDKYEAFMLRRVLITEPDARWCPAPDCGYVVIASSCASCPKLRCERPGCDTYFCYHCKHEWHPNQTCDSARAQRHTVNPHSASSVSFSQDSFTQRDDIKPCPCCKVPIIKMDDGSCNHMTCGVCSTEFCWLCMKEISDLHYLSPSGCTFWGKKPWSRKKKILWQLGMLVGAPVGIALIAGIAVPAIIIGIPVWVGRKLHTRYRQQVSSKHKRNLMVSGGVIASIVVSPILAGITVGIGVPILLAYVYGVVPISLCRSGGCGVTTSASGVRIEFDEDEPVAVPDGSGTGVVNPSIGEASLGMSASLSLGSGSHLERESASNTAIAGSIASAAATSHKLEVQADVSSNKRFSLSSHSETASATVSLADDAASTKALAGSLLGYRDSGTAAVTPVEVHVDAAGHQEPSCCAVHRSSLLRSKLCKAKYAEDSADLRECIVSFIDESQGSLEKPEFEMEHSTELQGGGIKRKASTKSVRLTYMQCKEDLRSAGDGEAWHSSHHHGSRLPDSRSLDHLYSICSHCPSGHFPSPEDGSRPSHSDNINTALNCSSSAITNNPCSDCTIINMSS